MTDTLANYALTKYYTFDNNMKVKNAICKICGHVKPTYAVENHFSTCKQNRCTVQEHVLS